MDPLIPAPVTSRMRAMTPLLARPSLPRSRGRSAPALAATPEVVPEQARLEGARQMARDNPGAVANIVKSWVNGDAAATPAGA